MTTSAPPQSFRSNRAEKGGAICVWDQGRLELYLVHFDGNAATGVTADGLRQPADIYLHRPKARSA